MDNERFMAVWKIGGKLSIKAHSVLDIFSLRDLSNNSRFLQNTELDVEEQCTVVQDFYTKMATHIQSNDSFRDNTPEQMEFLMDGIEKYVNFK